MIHKAPLENAVSTTRYYTACSLAPCHRAFPLSRPPEPHRITDPRRGCKSLRHNVSREAVARLWHRSQPAPSTDLTHADDQLAHRITVTFTHSLNHENPLIVWCNIIASPNDWPVRHPLLLPDGKRRALRAVS